MSDDLQREREARRIVDAALRDALARAEQLEQAIHEHRAAVLMGASSDADVSDADEALWKVLRP